MTAHRLQFPGIVRHRVLLGVVHLLQNRRLLGVARVSPSAMLLFRIGPVGVRYRDLLVGVAFVLSHRHHRVVGSGMEVPDTPHKAAASGLLSHW